jgi:hypothetical protein
VGSLRLEPTFEPTPYKDDITREPIFYVGNAGLSMINTSQRKFSFSHSVNQQFDDLLPKNEATISDRLKYLRSFAKRAKRVLRLSKVEYAPPQVLETELNHRLGVV